MFPSETMPTQGGDSFLLPSCHTWLAGTPDQGIRRLNLAPTPNMIDKSRSWKTLKPLVKFSLTEVIWAVPIPKDWFLGRPGEQWWFPGSPWAMLPLSVLCPVLMELWGLNCGWNLALIPWAGTAMGAQAYGTGLAVCSWWHGFARRLFHLGNKKPQVVDFSYCQGCQGWTSWRIPCSTCCPDIQS